MTRSKVRARVEHVFGAQTNDMGGTLVRSIGLVRAKARIGLKEPCLQHAPPDPARMARGGHYVTTLNGGVCAKFVVKRQISRSRQIDCSKAVSETGQRRSRRLMKFTDRDSDMIRWINGHGFAIIRQIAHWTGSSYQAAQRRTQTLAEAGFLEHQWPFRGERVYLPTRLAVARSGDELPPLNRIAHGSYVHDWK